MNVFRLFSDSADFSESNGDGWTAINELLIQSSANEIVIPSLQMWGAEIKNHTLGDAYARIGNYAFDFCQEVVVDLTLDLVGGKGFEARTNGCGYTLLMNLIARTRYTTASIKALLRRNPDLHATGTEIDIFPGEQSPTSLAILSSRAFFDWRAALDSVGVDLEVFVRRELEKGPLLKAGWTPETLLALFQHPHRWMGDSWYWEKCSDCLGEFDDLFVQPYWLDLLERYRIDKNPDILLETLSPLSDKARLAVEDRLSEEKDWYPNDVHYDPDIIGNEKDGFYVGPNSQKNWEDMEYPVFLATQARYELMWGEFICVECWLHYKETGVRKNPDVLEKDSEEDSEDIDDVSQHEYSPFLFNLDH